MDNQTSIILSHVKRILLDTIREDMFIETDKEIFPVSSLILKTLTLFRNIFENCELPLHETMPLVTLKGFQFLNKRNILNLHSCIKSQMLFEPKGPETLAEQIDLMLLLDYFIGENPTERSEFTAGIKFVPEFWTEIFTHPKLLQFFSKEYVLRSLPESSVTGLLSANIRKKIHDVYDTNIFTKTELMNIWPNVNVRLYKVSDHTLYFIRPMRENYHLLELIKVEKLHPSIKLNSCIISTCFYTENNERSQMSPDHKIMCDTNGSLRSPEGVYVPFKSRGLEILDLFIQGEQYLILECRYIRQHTRQQYTRNRIIK